MLARQVLQGSALTLLNHLPCLKWYEPQHRGNDTELLATLSACQMGVCRCRWAEVGEEVQEAVQAGRLGLSQEQVHAQLCQALLRLARFNLAKQYLTGQSPSCGVLPRALLVWSLRLPQCDTTLPAQTLLRSVLFQLLCDTCFLSWHLGSACVEY